MIVISYVADFGFVFNGSTVRNEWSYTPKPPCLYGIDRNNFTF